MSIPSNKNPHGGARLTECVALVKHVVPEDVVKDGFLFKRHYAKKPVVTCKVRWMVVVVVDG